MDPSTPKDAAAAVAALYFCAFLMALFNVRYTGFKLYMAIAFAGLARGVSYATRAAFVVKHDFAYMAASRATAAVGLGISIAMCSCFLIIWLRNANPHHQPPRAPRIITPICKVLVACVIICGPFLGVIAAAVIYGNPKDVKMASHGMEIRKASASGFLAVEGLIAILIAFVAINWTIGSNKNWRQEQQQQQQQHKPQLQGDQLILLLLFCNLLLLWAAAANVSTITHPNIITDTNLHFPVQVLPELMVAFIWSFPALVAKIALGSRYDVWRQQQQQQQQGRRQQQQQQDPEEQSGSEIFDATAITDDSAPVKGIEMAEQQ